ncbi:MAG TPA: CsbD family protein [Caulobacteraceae bacterium]|nr:CsbD family protein [Caulobacteraceae bacterium]
MNKQQIEGATQKAVGSAKDATGRAIGSEKLQAEGLADKAAGSAKQAYGDVKNAAHKATR